MSCPTQFRFQLSSTDLFQMVLVPMAAIEGSNSLHFAKGPVGWSHPDLPALRLASAVLNAAESYLWTAVRGSGLAYGANMEVDAESGFTGFSVYRVSTATSCTCKEC